MDNNEYFKYKIDEYDYYVGKNQHSNHNLITSSERNEEDYWIHASNISSPHGIIVNSNNEKLSLKQLKKACMLMKVNNNKLKKINPLCFDITKLKHVILTDTEGLVHIEKVIKNIRI